MIFQKWYNKRSDVVLLASAGIGAVLAPDTW